MPKHMLAAAVVMMVAAAAYSDELLYNGIKLSDEWPPRPESFSRDQPITPPYLVEPPNVIPIDVGRQLFVDDFLIADTTLRRTFHQPTYHSACPIFKAEDPWEIRRDTGCAAPFSEVNALFVVPRLRHL